MYAVRNKFMTERVKFVPDPDVKTRTKQQFAKDCDINFLMGRYAKGIPVDHLAKWEGSFGDFPAMDFQEAMNLVAGAQEMFADLPSDVRARFANSPFEFLRFTQELAPDGKSLANIDELRKLNLAKPAPEQELRPVDRRLAELKVDREARLELARESVKLPPEGE